MRFQTSRQAAASMRQGLCFGSPMANAWGRSLLRHLSAELTSARSEEAKPWRDRIVSTAQALFDARRPVPANVAVCTVFGVSALMVSAYQILGIELGRSDRALAIVERAFVLTYRAYIRNVCLPLLQGGRLQPHELAGMTFRAWGRQMPSVASGHGVMREILRAPESPGYRHFFEAHGAPSLAQIIQTADEAWIQALAGDRDADLAPGYPLWEASPGFSPFHFSPARARPARRRPDTVLELDLGTSPAGWDAFDAHRSETWSCAQRLETGPAPA